MLKRILTGAAVATMASLCLAQAAGATTLTFDDVDLGAAPYGHYPNDLLNGGLHFTDYEMDILSAPIAAPTTGNNGQFLVFGSGSYYLEPLVITLDDGGLGGAFSLQSLRLALGDYNDATLGSFDQVTITGVRSATCTTACADPSVTFDVGYGFQLFNLVGFNNLSSVTIGQQMIGPPGRQRVEDGFLALDDLRYAVGDAGPGAVPEPAAWAMMLVGFGGLGAVLRRRRHAALAA